MANKYPTGQLKAMAVVSPKTKDPRLTLGLLILLMSKPWNQDWDIASERLGKRTMAKTQTTLTTPTVSEVALAVATGLCFSILLTSLLMIFVFVIMRTVVHKKEVRQGTGQKY